MGCNGACSHGQHELTATVGARINAGPDALVEVMRPTPGAFVQARVQRGRSALDDLTPSDIAVVLSVMRNRERPPAGRRPPEPPPLDDRPDEPPNWQGTSCAGPCEAVETGWGTVTPDGSKHPTLAAAAAAARKEALLAAKVDAVALAQEYANRQCKKKGGPECGCVFFPPGAKTLKPTGFGKPTAFGGATLTAPITYSIDLSAFGRCKLPAK